MSLPRVRFTVRRMMLAVAIAAVALGSTAELKRRSDRFRRLAEEHNQRVIVGRMVTRRGGGTREFFYDRSGNPVPEWERHLLKDAWHAKLKIKYYEASRHPWLPVPPDPPEPK